MEKKFEPLFLDWLLTIKKAQVLQRTFDKLMSLAKHHILPSLGNINIDEIDSIVMQSFFTNTLCRDKNMSLPRVKECKCVLNGFFDYCYKSAFIAQNPAASIELNQKTENKKTNRKGISVEDRQQFIDAVSANRFWKPFCLTIMYTGLKIGEILPLKWRDIDFENKTIAIKNAIAANIVFSDEGKVLKRSHYISPSLIDKTIPLSDTVINILTEYKRFRERQQRQQRKCSYVGEDDIVFGNEDSELRSFTGISHMLARFLKQKGIEGVNFYTLKHTYREMQKEKELKAKKEAALALKIQQKKKAIARYSNARQREIEMT